MRRWALLALSSAAIIGPPAAFADSRSVSYSTWVMAGNTISLRFILPAPAAAQLLGVQVPVLTSSKLGEYLLGHITVRAGGRDCPAIDQGYDLGRVDPLAVGAGYFGFEIFYRCTQLSDVLLSDDAFIDQIPSHVNFARLEWGDRRAEAIFTSTHRTVHFATRDALPQRVMSAYLRLGVAHVLHSLDRLCLLVAILALARRRGDVACALMGLAAGYAFALALTATSDVMPYEDLLEASTGLIIGLIAFAIVLRQTERPRVAAAAWPVLLVIVALVALMRHATSPALLLFGGACFSASFLALAAVRPTVQPTQLIAAMLFGFLDGFVLPSEQALMQLPKRVQLPMLVGFDLGACLTAALLMLAVSGLHIAVSRRARAELLVHRLRSLEQILAACLSAAGSFWLLSHLHL